MVNVRGSGVGIVIFMVISILHADSLVSTSLRWFLSFHLDISDGSLVVSVTGLLFSWAASMVFPFFFVLLCWQFGI